MPLNRRKSLISHYNSLTTNSEKGCARVKLRNSVCGLETHKGDTLRREYLVLNRNTVFKTQSIEIDESWIQSTWRKNSCQEFREKIPRKGGKVSKKDGKRRDPRERDEGGRGVIATRWKVKACHQIKLLQNFADVQAFKFSFKHTAAVGELTSIDYSAAVLTKIRWFTCKWIFQCWNNCDSNLSKVTFTMIYHKLRWHSLCAASDTNSTSEWGNEMGMNLLIWGKIRIPFGW